jgi:hypothetical protein
MNIANKNALQKKSLLTDAKSKSDPQTEKGKQLLTDANSTPNEQTKQKRSGKAGTPNNK